MNPGARIVCSVVVAVAALALAGPSAAGDFALGLRADIGLGSGKPTNDVPGYGVHGFYSLSDRWNLGFALDHSTKFDLKNAPALVGLVTPKVINQIGQATTISVWVEGFCAGSEGRFEFFWRAGGAFNTVSMDDLQGVLVNGSMFDVRTEAGSDFQGFLGGGVRRWFRSRWAIELAVQRDHHLADWTMTDRVSGNTGTIGNYAVNTINLGFLRKLGGNR